MNNTSTRYFLSKNRLGSPLYKQEGSRWYTYDLWYNKWSDGNHIFCITSLDNIKDEEAFLWMMEHQ